MVKKSIMFFVFLIYAQASVEFEKNCLSCHGDDFKFNIIMKKYTLKYSSEAKIKKAIFDYLKEPSFENSILPLEYIKKFGIKQKSSLTDDTLEQMVDIYYEKFNLPSKLR